MRGGIRYIRESGQLPASCSSHKGPSTRLLIDDGGFVFYFKFYEGPNDADVALLTSSFWGAERMRESGNDFYRSLGKLRGDELAQCRVFAQRWQACKPEFELVGFLLELSGCLSSFSRGGAEFRVWA